MGAVKDILLSNPPSWVIPGASVDLDFVNSRYFIQGSGNSLSPTIFTRSSVATYFDQTGTIQSAASGIPRLQCYDPATFLPLGFYSEWASTNSVRNNTASTFWSVFNGIGLSTSFVGSGTENGINYVDVRVFGTSANITYRLGFETNNQIAAASGQTWSESFFVKQVGGTLNNIVAGNWNCASIGFTSGGANSGDGAGSTLFSMPPSTTNLAATRKMATGTAGQATTAFLAPFIAFDAAGTGLAIDVTFRIGLPQMEQFPTATSPIVTTGTAATRSADVMTLPKSSWWNPLGFTLLTSAYRYAGSAATVPSVGVSSLNDNSNSNVFQITNSNGSFAVVDAAMAGGTGDYALSVGTYTPGTIYKVAYGSNSSSALGVMTGGTVQSATPSTFATTAAAITQLAVGSTVGTTRPVNGFIQRIAVVPQLLPAASMTQYVNS